MTTATRLATDMGNWIPVTRHYHVEGGFLAVTVAKLFTATGTRVFYCDELGGPHSMEPLVTFPDGTSHDTALQQLGYTVVDGVGPEPEPEPADNTTAYEQSVLDMLPEPIAAMIANATEGS